MPAHIDTLRLAKAFEEAGQKPALAQGMARAISDVAMKDVPSQSDLREAIHTMTVRVGIMIAGSTLALIITVVGALISVAG
ncbi:hypothetical protein [Novosphingobium sp. JCM 18896]|uniref:hypothetical protein n=1 Tax=Novosphingobium sp. JCM 18896 TaxID=2989731 RepID=UPI0022221528|nr:hypothetical protein [Novosphingobium sp. JCM 18896]MCW1428516.1 hypothetical protein [Novosphingobium sp. JCM 18896]